MSDQPRKLCEMPRANCAKTATATRIIREHRYRLCQFHIEVVDDWRRRAMSEVPSKVWNGHTRST
jgi:hypothetical protein